MEEEIKKWLEYAKRDLNTAYYLFSGKKFEESGFFCQQSVEKTLKAILLKKEKQIIKTHDLLFLAEKANLPEELKNNCKELTLVYVFTRYPDTPKVNGMKNKAKKYLGIAEAILKWTEKQL